MKHETLYGTYAVNPCAYCKKHDVSLTVKQIKKKQCITRACWHFKKYEHHEYWRQKAILKAKRKARKKEMKKMYGY